MLSGFGSVESVAKEPKIRGGRGRASRRGGSLKPYFYIVKYILYIIRLRGQGGGAVGPNFRTVGNSITRAKHIRVVGSHVQWLNAHGGHSQGEYREAVSGEYTLGAGIARRAVGLRRGGERGEIGMVPPAYFGRPVKAASALSGIGSFLLLLNIPAHILDQLAKIFKTFDASSMRLNIGRRQLAQNPVQQGNLNLQHHLHASVVHDSIPLNLLKMAPERFPARSGSCSRCSSSELVCLEILCPQFRELCIRTRCVDLVLEHKRLFTIACDEHIQNLLVQHTLDILDTGRYKLCAFLRRC